MNRGFYVDRAVKAVRFIEGNRYWTLKDLREHLGISKSNARRYRDALSRHYPVRVARHIENGGGTRPALYTIYYDEKAEKERRLNALKSKASEIQSQISDLQGE